MATRPLPVDGIDISHHQSGALDFAGAKKRGLKWVYHKATEGKTFIDSRYKSRRAEVRAAGLPFGAYHFARASRGDARAEAKHFLSVANPKPGDLKPCLDIETTEGMGMDSIRTWISNFIKVVENEVGVKPVLYTPFALEDVGRGCVIWRPRYNNANDPPHLAWDIWQFSNGVFGVPNSLAGIGRVDLNVMRRNLKVADLLIPKPEPQPVQHECDQCGKVHVGVIKK